MKALVLAAGFGTRLAPYSETLPKPLFTLNNRTVLARTIDHLVRAGCSRIFINTHHLADQITAHVDGHPQQDRLTLVYEPEILDTGGAVANLRAEFHDDDFLVVNADIVHDLDLAAVVEDHKRSNALATLVLHDHDLFNKIRLGPDNEILGFDAPKGTGLAFTGIQVLSPKILAHLPDKSIFSIIDLYRATIPTGRIRACLPRNFYWNDMGTVDRYADTAARFLAGQSLGLAPDRFHEIKIQPLAGDGSDRKWYRAALGDRAIVLSDHGICLEGTDNRRQLEAFVKIGTHLNRAGVRVPAILAYDTVSGLAAVEDLGSVHLADLARDLGEEDLISLYKRVIDLLIVFSRKGIQGFDPDWTCQTPSYSREMVLEFECRYFLNAFLNGYLGCDPSWEKLLPAFSYIADQACAEGPVGLMHRDCQSRNIMICREQLYFIDFQSARTGPLAYDLASLLIDPYVTLPQRVQTSLLAYCSDCLAGSSDFDADRFRRQYQFCAITRNLQMLGAFGLLTRVKKKSWFEAHIPAALKGLKQRLAPLASGPAEPLVTLVNTL